MKQFLKQHQYFIFAFLIFVILAVISGYQSLQIPNNKYQITNKIQNSNEQTTNTTSLDHFITTSLPTDNRYQITGNKPTPPMNPPQGGNTTTYPLVTSYELRVINTSTAYELLKKSQIDFKTKTFSGMGEFLEEINGVKNDNQAGTYWIYYINGESAKLGISQQIVKPLDIITWKYETANF